MKTVRQDADFFSATNLEAKRVREQLAFEVLDSMLDWLEGGGDVSVFDATNTTSNRRLTVLRRCQARASDLPVMFVESVCDDKRVLESNLRVKAANSPDYKHMPIEQALADLRLRIAEYEKVYETITDDRLSYIKLINLMSKVVCNRIHGKLGHMTLAYLLSVHVRPRPIYLVRAGHCPREKAAEEGKQTPASPSTTISPSSSDHHQQQPTSPQPAISTISSAAIADAVSTTMASVTADVSEAPTPIGTSPTTGAMLSSPEIPEMTLFNHPANFRIPPASTTALRLSDYGQAFSKRLSDFLSSRLTQLKQKLSLDSNSELIVNAEPIPTPTPASNSSDGKQDSTPLTPPSPPVPSSAPAAPAPTPAPLCTRSSSGGGASSDSSTTLSVPLIGDYHPPSPLQTGLSCFSSSSMVASPSHTAFSVPSPSPVSVPAPATGSMSVSSPGSAPHRTMSVAPSGKAVFTVDLVSSPSPMPQGTETDSDAIAFSSVHVYTSTLPRAVDTVQHIAPHAAHVEQASALNPLETGLCHGLTIEEIQEKMPEEIVKWRLNKFKYRFPGGESHWDRSLALKPLVMELERHTDPVLVVSHSSTLQVLYGYFLGSSVPANDFYNLEIPMHTVVELIPNQYGWQETRYQLGPILPAEEDDGGPRTSSTASPTRQLHGTDFYSEHA